MLKYVGFWISSYFLLPEMVTIFQWFGFLIGMYVIILTILIKNKNKKFGNILIILCSLNIFLAIVGIFDGGKIYYLGNPTTPDILFYIQLILSGFQYGKGHTYNNTIDRLYNSFSVKRLFAVSEREK